MDFSAKLGFLVKSGPRRVQITPGGPKAPNTHYYCHILRLLEVDFRKIEKYMAIPANFTQSCYFHKNSTFYDILHILALFAPSGPFRHFLSLALTKWPRKRMVLCRVFTIFTKFRKSGRKSIKKPFTRMHMLLLFRKNRRNRYAKYIKSD